MAGVMVVLPDRVLAQRPLGIDVSSYQETINWTSVKGAGITFAWAKATEGLSYIDAYFTANEANAKAAGVLIGAYHFAHPELHLGTAGADQEAAYFWNEAGGYIKTNGNSYLMPMLDFEQDVTSASPAYTQASLSAWLNEWCQDIVNYGKANGVVVVPVVYTYVSYAAGTSGHGPGLNSTVTQWPLWMASPNGESAQTGAPSATYPWSTWDVWQYGQADIAGVTTGVVDEDVFNGTAAALTNTLVIGKATASGGAGATVYWDPGDKNASPGSGGTGTWDTTTSDWWLSGTGDTAWSAGGDYAVFAGTAGTVTLGTLVSADGITFNTAGYVLSGSGTLVLNGTTPVISVPPGSPTYITSVVGGSGYELTGGGVLVLENAGNYCGNSTSAEYVNGPNTCLVVLSDHDTGNQGVTLNLENGGIYQDNDTTSGDQFLLPGCAIALLTGGGIFDNPNASLTMSNHITGSGSLTFTGYTNSSGTPYVLTLTDTGNNYSGGTIVQGPSELKANAAGTLGSTSGPLTINGGILDLGGASHTVGAVTISAGTIQDGTLTGSSYTGQSGTVSAILAGSGGLTKNGTGQLTLSGANTFTGKISISGTSRSIIQISADSNLGAAPGSAVANQITLNGGVGVGLRVTGNTTINANRGIT
jgi:autotransporter-associated beta strand protein